MNLKTTIKNIEDQLGISGEQPTSEFCQCAGELTVIEPSLEQIFEPLRETFCPTCNKPQEIRVVELSDECIKDIELIYGDHEQ